MIPMDPDAVEDVSSALGGGDDASRLRRTADGNCLQEEGTEQGILDFSAIVSAWTPDGVAQVYESALAGAQSYPANDYSAFRATAADYVGCEATQVVPTAGRLAAIRLAVATTVDAGKVLIPVPSCRTYAREVRLQGGSPTFRPRQKLLETDPAPFQLVVACQPNNPTGEAYDPDALRSFADRCVAAETPLLLDESALPLTELESLAGRSGVIVVRSPSAVAGLPGLRTGFVVATGAQLERLDTARLTWGVGTPGRAVGMYCMERPSFLEAARTRIRRERGRMYDRLEPRFEIHGSDAPFLLLGLPESRSVDDLLSTLRESRIAVRDARTFHGLDNHVRVTVRTAADNDRLLDALDA